VTKNMSAYSATLTDEVMTVARRAFERYDHDNSGTIQVEVVFPLHVQKQRAVDLHTLTYTNLAGHMPGIAGGTT